MCCCLSNVCREHIGEGNDKMERFFVNNSNYISSYAMDFIVYGRSRNGRYTERHATMMQRYFHLWYHAEKKTVGSHYFPKAL